MPKLWRIETNHSRTGVYTVAGALILNHMDHVGDRHPTPYDERNLKGVFGTDHHCGFRSLKQMHQWFNRKTLRALAKWEGQSPMVWNMGETETLVLRQYEVPAHAIHYGARQVIFEAAKACVVGERSLVSDKETHHDHMP